MVNIYTYFGIFLEDAHKQVGLNDFERYFKRPHQTIKAHLDVLVASRILLQDKRKRFLFYRLNLENPLTYEYLVVCEKQRLMEFLKKELLLRLYETLYPGFKNSKILIFGSATNSREYSDIDILIITKDNKIRETLRKFELTYSVKIHSIITTEKNYGIGDTLLIELPSQKIQEHFKLQPGMLIYLVDGKHTGETGVLDEIKKDIITYTNNSKQKVQTLKKYAYVIGKEKSAIQLQ